MEALLNFDLANAYFESLTTEDFLQALAELELSENDLKMLQAIYQAERSTLTAKQMTQALGYKHFGAANLHFGKLGHRFADRLQVSLEYPIMALATMDWPNQECEWTLRPQLSRALESLKLVHREDDDASNLSTEQLLTEGRLLQATTNTYERNVTARRLCIEHYGTSCCVCGFSFERSYGEAFRDFIHVHHLKELSEISQEYIVDPIKDLRPVCPNCHAVIHQRRPAYTIQEVREFLRTSLQMGAS